MQYVNSLTVIGPEVKMANSIITINENVGSIDICVELTGSGYQLGRELTVTLTDIGTPNSVCM